MFEKSTAEPQKSDLVVRWVKVDIVRLPSFKLLSCLKLNKLCKPNIRNGKVQGIFDTRLTILEQYIDPLDISDDGHL